MQFKTEHILFVLALIAIVFIATQKSPAKKEACCGMRPAY